MLKRLADREIRALGLLIHAREIDDETVGFHAQQAVEKCLKAILALSTIPFRKTHDLQELMDLLLDNKKTPPPNAEQLDALNPCAVLMRNDFVELKGFNRHSGLNSPLLAAG